MGPYSQAVRIDNWLYCSGQVAIDPTTQQVCLFGGSVGKQVELVLSNLKNVLLAAGGDLSSVVRTTVYLRDMKDFAEVNEIYSNAFGGHRPARACVAVSGLPKDVAVEIDAVAYLG